MSAPSEAPSRGPVTDREVYPALWAALGLLAAGYLLWRFPLGRPTVSACWFYSRFHIYCPGCGGTRALTALAHGQVVRSMYYHPAVPFAAVSAGGYLASQTVWRLRGRRGWVLRWDIRWLYAFLVLLAVNCALRNLLWVGFGVPLA